MYTTIIFDFFDVIHSDPALRWFHKNNIERTGKYAELFDNVDSGNINLDEAYKKLSLMSGCSLEDIQQAFESNNMIDYDVIKLINNLKNNYKIGLLSNANSGYLRSILDKNKLIGLFDCILISSEIGLIKPSLDIFELALRKLQTTASQTIFIDDSKINIESAMSYGIYGLLFIDAKTLSQDLMSLGIKIS